MKNEVQTVTRLSKLKARHLLSLLALGVIVGAATQIRLPAKEVAQIPKLGASFIEIQTSLMAQTLDEGSIPSRFCEKIADSIERAQELIKRTESSPLVFAKSQQLLAHLTLVQKNCKDAPIDRMKQNLRSANLLAKEINLMMLDLKISSLNRTQAPTHSMRRSI
jgi:hypothetical protein